ncbi:protein VASCULATURE COMPLEXITY AND CONNECTIVITY-like [Typha angustifolia]|uniref:protein VASCULATURE COMPLEXITY AND CONNECTIVITY-like n=1 Tax=Typha angustifolia TaxID=59011 RepID=UPI003C2B7183
MESHAIRLCAVGGVLGLLSLILGIAAEYTRIKPSEIAVHFKVCEYPSSPALGLAFTAAVILILAQVLIAIASGCCGCCRTNTNGPAANRTLTVILSVLSWIAFAIALILFISGAIVNGSGGRQVSLNSYHCTYLKPGVFVGASVLALAAVSLAIGGVILQPMPTPTPGSAQMVVEIGQPQFPISQSQCPPVYPPTLSPQFPPQTNHPVFIAQQQGYNKL